jgi:hypothetical protein
MRIIGFHLANIWEQGTKGCLVPHHFISTECLSTEYVQQTGTSKQETVLPFISETILARGTDQGTSLSLIPTIIGNTSQLLYARTPVRSEKKARPRLKLRNPFNLNFFDSAQCLMVRRWRLIGYFPDLNFFDSAQCLMVRRWRLIGLFPILYNPLRAVCIRLRASEQH